MSKRSRQTLKAIIAAGVIAGMVGTAQFKPQAASVNELYANAYTATVNAMNTKTQKSINSARIAIEALRGTGAGFAIGEFSKQVDQVQHPFLVSIVDAINKASETNNQEDINAARTFIDPELPEVWRNSYSSAIDIIQQKLMKEFIDAYHKAAITRVPADVEIFKSKLAELKLASDTAVGAWADEFKKPMDTVWDDAELKNTQSIVEKTSLELESYTPVLLSEEGSEVISQAFIDADKTIKSIWSINMGYVKGMYYSDDKLVYIADIASDETGDYIYEMFFKDGELVKWIVQEYSAEEVKGIKVYDRNSLPQNLEIKLSEYKQASDQLHSDALIKVNN